MQFRRLSSASFASLALVLVPLLSACPGGYEEDGHEDELGETATDTTGTETTSDESAGDQGSSETAETGTETADTTETTDDTTETTDDTTETTDDTTETTDDTTETTDGTTGDPSLNEQLCMDACGVFADCLGGGGLPDCFNACLDYHDSLEGECLGFEQDLTSCIIGLSCDELDQFLENDPEPYPCQAEEALVCEEQVCEVGVGGGEQPDECSFEYACPNDPVYEVVCENGECTCLEDDVEVGGCSDAVEFCSEVGELGPANTCCGWEL
jgi:hypothetical protein